MNDYAIFGSAFAIRRYEKYKRQVSWEYHSHYKGHDIYRAYELLTDQLDGPRKQLGLYRIPYGEGFIVGDGLAQIRDAFNEFTGKKEGRR